ncbi:MAG: hypothetical protein ABJK25_08780 [Halieaceae bacterium]
MQSNAMNYRLLHISALLLILIAIAYYFHFLYQHSLNVPLGDDIYDVLKVMSGVVASQDLGAGFEILFEQHNDHRTLASRLMYSLVLLATGEIDFRTLTFVANMALPLLMLVLYVAIPESLPRLMVLLPAALTILQLRAYGITLWSMAAFAYFYVFLYGYASLHFLHRITLGRFFLACLFATLSTFTLASGQVIWVVGLLSLFHQSFIHRSSSKIFVLLWILVGASVLLVWRIGLQTPNTLWAMLEQFLLTPEHHVLYTLTLLGSALSEHMVSVAALAGAVMLISLIISSLHGYRKRDIRLELYCWFIVFSAAAMVLGRAPYSTVDYALSSRYSFPSVLMLATVWVMIAVRLQVTSWKLLVVMSALAAAYCINSYDRYSEALQPHVEKRVRNYNQGKYWAWYRPMKETKAIVTEAALLGIYNPPEKPLPEPIIFLPDVVQDEDADLEKK